MAQKLLLRLFQSVPLKHLSVPLRSPPSSLLSRVSALSCHTVLCRSLPTTAARAAATRTFSTTQVFRDTFNVQDGDDFQDRVLKSQKPVVVDFHAQWCGPCKILGPRLEKMVAKQKGRVLMAKVDIDDHTDLALEYEVSAVPTVLALKNGSVVDKFVGIKDEDQLEAFLKKLVGP
ncbi:PREDICTED: thioredoxin, mitochondrial [Gekko japonicus]|uniref:Thioredoxin, mitochondrial n=1 Tax=Gekko japonicus TaxID=146911 RepID=A0ABM1JW45_GEKJA|nr:PREDICTED: thioredoxin, mitochondrial [Gekko japonicus]XP_015265682.1 PREDICTED: thioredoxin, mitochondrial [Gekko japonicus]XP_015265683.1 PREDICTED: thioredoxin, mitochondrial [Gekko japonicus]